MLIKLSLKNIRYYAGSYLVYLGTVALSACICYLFAAFANGMEMQLLQENAEYDVLFTVGRAMLLIFSAAFIWYSTDYFLARRKREIGFYLLLGMRKRDVGFVLFCETMVLGLLAVIAGLLAGVALIGIYHQPQTADLLSVSQSSELFLQYAAVFLILGLLNASAAYANDLNHLFHAEESNEKEVKASGFSGLLAVIVLGFGNWLIFQARNAATIKLIPPGIALVMLGTFLLFYDGMAWLCQRLRHSEACARNAALRISVTGIISSIRRNALMWTTVALLISVSISLVILAISFDETMMQMDREVPGEQQLAVIRIFQILLLVISLCGVLCLAATGSMLYFKARYQQTADARNNALLYSLGVARKGVRRIAAGQIRVLFLLPLAVGILQTILFSVYIAQRHLLHSVDAVLSSILIYGLIYSIYYFLASRNGGRLERVRDE